MPKSFDINTLTVEDRDAMESMKSNDYAEIEIDDAEDAATFNRPQLLFIRDIEPRRFERLDFLHLSDRNIVEIVMFKEDVNDSTVFPYNVRRKATLIRQHFRHGKGARIQAEKKSDELLHKYHIAKTQQLTTAAEVLSSFTCFGNSLSILLNSAGESEDAAYHDKLAKGYESLVRKAIRNKAEELKYAKESPGFQVRHELMSFDGFVLNETNNQNSDCILVLKSKGDRKDIDDDDMIRFMFCAPTCEQLTPNAIICDSCKKSQHNLRRRCKDRAEADNSDYKVGQRLSYTFDSPSRMKKYNNTNKKQKDNTRNQLSYYKKKYNTIIAKDGIEIASDSAVLIFNDETEKACGKFLDGNEDFAEQKDLISYLCKQSWDNTRRSQRSGKKTVRYCPVVLKFATFVRSKMGNSSYDFLSSVFTLPSSRTLNNYDTLDSNAEDGVGCKAFDEHEFESLNEIEIFFGYKVQPAKSFCP